MPDEDLVGEGNTADRAWKTAAACEDDVDVDDVDVMLPIAETSVNTLDDDENECAWVSNDVRIDEGSPTPPLPPAADDAFVHPSL